MSDAQSNRLLVDQPSTLDRLRFNRYVAALNQLLFDQETPATPMTIGIYGSWGSGKSTLLGLLRREFDPEDNNLWPERLRANDAAAWNQANERAKKFIPIEFSPWTYQHEPSLLVPLLLTFKETTREKLTAQIKKIAAVTGYYYAKKLLFPALKIASAGLVDAQEVKKTGEEIEEELQRGLPKMDLGDQTKLRQLVQRVVTKARGKSQRTLVVFIDDLDRCHPPDRIVDLLEQIKVFLSLEGCIFILACDREVVVRAIENKFPGHGEAYLEKFIQIPFHLPDSQSPDVAALVWRSEGFGLSDLEADPEWRAYLEHVCAALGNNPRRFKRFYNTWLVAWNVLQNEKDVTVTKYLLAKWLLLRETSRVLAEEHFRMLIFENLLPTSGRISMSELEKDYGLTTEVRLFLQKDSERKFGTIQTLSVYTKLTGRDLDITREDIEERVAKGRPLPPDLTAIDLSRAYLANGNFSGVNLTKTKFTDARIDGAVFDGADLVDADFTRARFRSISLRNVKNLATVIADDETLSRLQASALMPPDK